MPVPMSPSPAASTYTICPPVKASCPAWEPGACVLPKKSDKTPCRSEYCEYVGIVLDVVERSLDLGVGPVAVDGAVLSVLDDRVDDRLRYRSLCDHREHKEEHEGYDECARELRLHVFTPLFSTSSHRPGVGPVLSPTPRARQCCVACRRRRTPCGPGRNPAIKLVRLPEV